MFEKYLCEFAFEIQICLDKALSFGNGRQVSALGASVGRAADLRGLQQQNTVFCGEGDGGLVAPWQVFFVGFLPSIFLCSSAPFGTMFRAPAVWLLRTGPVGSLASGF